VDSGNSKADFISTIPYFSGLQPAQLQSITGHIFEKAAERNEFIVSEGDDVDALYVVLSGALKALKTSAEGREQILRIIRPGDSFNDVPVFDGGPCPASVQAMGPVSLYGFSTTSMRTILRQHPVVALNAVVVLAGRVRHYVSVVEDLAFKHVMGRVAKLLLDHSREDAEARPKLTQQEMAATVGTVREMVSRSLKTLEERRLIRMDRHRIVILDADGLREASE